MVVQQVEAPLAEPGRVLERCRVHRLKQLDQPPFRACLIHLQTRLPQFDLEAPAPEHPPIRPRQARAFLIKAGLLAARQVGATHQSAAVRPPSRRV